MWRKLFWNEHRKVRNFCKNKTTPKLPTLWSAIAQPYTILNSVMLFSTSESGIYKFSSEWYPDDENVSMLNHSKGERWISLFQVNLQWYNKLTSSPRYYSSNSIYLIQFMKHKTCSKDAQRLLSLSIFCWSIYFLPDKQESGKSWKAVWNKSYYVYLKYIPTRNTKYGVNVHKKLLSSCKIQANLIMLDVPYIMFQWCNNTLLNESPRSSLTGTAELMATEGKMVQQYYWKHWWIFFFLLLLFMQKQRF